MLTPSLAAPAFVITVLLWGTLVPGMVARHPALQRWLPAWLVLGGALAAWWLAAGAEAVPTHSLIVLREGRERAVIQAISNHHPWLVTYDTYASPPLRDTVWVHAGVQILTMWLLGVIATARRLGWGVPLAFAILWSPLGVHALWSDSMGAELTLLTVLGLQLAHVATSNGGWARRVALAGLVCATLAAGALRPEAVILGGLTTLTALLAPLRVWPADTTSRASAAIQLLSVVLVAQIASLAMANAGHWVTVPWAVDTESTIRPPFLALAQDTLAFVSVGPALVALIGLAWLSTRHRLGAAAALGTLMTTVALSRAAHDGAAPYELLRYGVVLVGTLACAALFAGAALGRHRAGQIVVIAAALTAMLRPVLAPDVLPSHPAAHIQTTQVANAQWWMHVHEAYPDCLYVTQIASTPDFTPDAAGQHFIPRTAYLGGPYGWSIPRWEPPASLPDCIVAVSGFDCALTGVRCEPPPAAWRLLEERRGSWPEHNHHHGVHTQPISLTIHAPP